MILTRAGWYRSTFEQRRRQRERTAQLPTIFRCTCAQCYCGCIEIVVFRGVPLCKHCGRPRRDVYGKIIPVAHAWYCSKAKKHEGVLR